MADLAMLSQHIITDLYGDLVGKVATVLIERGRMALPQICRLLPAVKTQHIRMALIILVQHHMLWMHCQPQHSDDAPHQSTLDYFEPNYYEILSRLRFATFIGMAEQIGRPLGPNQAKEYRRVVHRILTLGTVSIDTLLDDLSNSDVKKRELYHDIVARMIKERYLYATTSLQASHPVDHYQSIRTSSLAEQKVKISAASSKAKREAEARARETFIEERANDRLTANERLMKEVTFNSFQQSPVLVHHSKKRARGALDDDTVFERHSKYARLHNVSGSLHGASAIRVDYSPFLLKMRNKAVLQAVRSKFGKPAMLVMQALFALVDSEIQHDQRALRLDTEFSSHFQVDLILSQVVQEYDRSFAVAGKTAGTSAQVQDYLRSAFVNRAPIVSEDENKRITWDSSKQLSLFFVREICDTIAYSAEKAEIDDAEEAEDEEDAAKKPAKYQKRNDRWLERSETGWRLSFHAMHKSLKRALVLGIVEQIYGKESVRIMRILDTYGRLDEKAIHKIALMSAKEVRKIVDTLLNASLIQSQEIPRTVDRRPSHNFYLWFIDWNKTYQMIRNGILQELGNIYARRLTEYANVNVLLIKSRRKEVQADRTLLLESEWTELERFEERMLYLRTAEMRSVHDLTILDLPETVLDDIQAV